MVEDVVARLNLARLDWDNEYGEGSSAEVVVPLDSSCAIGIRGSSWGGAPTEYLDAFCDALKARGVGDGRLTRHAEPELDWIPYGPEPTITTVLGYGQLPNIDPPHRPWDIWHDQPSMVAHLVDLAVNWVDAGKGVLTYSGEMVWHPTVQQLRNLLAADLSRHLPVPIQTGRLAGSRPPQDTDGVRTGSEGRTGRTAVFARGYLILTENDQNRTLNQRLSDHQSALSDGSVHAAYGFTTGTIGHGLNDPKMVMSERPEFWDQTVRSVPHQRPGYTAGLPDAYYSQLFDAALLPSARDLSSWLDQPAARHQVVLTAQEPAPWFTIQPAPYDRRPGWTRNDADPATLAAARASFGEMLQAPATAR